MLAPNPFVAGNVHTHSRTSSRAEDARARTSFICKVVEIPQRERLGCVGGGGGSNVGTRIIRSFIICCRCRSAAAAVSNSILLAAISARRHGSSITIRTLALNTSHMSNVCDLCGCEQSYTFWFGACAVRERMRVYLSTGNASTHEHTQTRTLNARSSTTRRQRWRCECESASIKLRDHLGKT